MASIQADEGRTLPTMFAAVEVAETCFIHEAVYWIAFGRVPQARHDPSDNGRDVRRGKATEDSYFLPAVGQPAFSQAEFEVASVEMTDLEYGRYLRSREPRDDQEALVVRPYEYNLIMEGRSRLSQRIQQSIIERFGKRAPVKMDLTKKGKQHDDIHNWAFQQEKKMRPMLDRAWTLALTKLQSGELVAKGYVDALQQKDKPEVRGSWESIAAELWDSRELDREEGRLRTPTTSIRALQVEFKRVLELFPHPICRHLDGFVHKFPGVMLNARRPIADPDASPPQRRGRPPIANADMVTLVAVVFGGDVQRLRGPDRIKRTALSYDIIEYLRAQKGISIGKSTADKIVHQIEATLARLVPESNSEK